MPPSLVILIILAAVGVAFAAWWLSPPQRTKRALRGAQQHPIGQFPVGGYHKVVGRLVLTTEPLRAPLSGRACAAYEVLVEERVQSNKRSYWRTVIHEVRSSPFVLDDGTGRARVDPTHAELLIHRDQHSRSGTFDDPTAEEQAYLDEHGQQGQGWFFNKSLRYREGVLEPDETVAVLGMGLREGGELQLRPAGDRHLYVSDDSSTMA